MWLVSAERHRRNQGGLGNGHLPPRAAQESLGHCSTGTAAMVYPALEGKTHVPLLSTSTGGPWCSWSRHWVQEGQIWLRIHPAGDSHAEGYKIHLGTGQSRF